MFFEEDRIYHIFNRGNDRRQTFYTSRNYEYFLDKIGKEVYPYANILAYCLMPNHFHLLIRAKDIGCQQYEMSGNVQTSMQVLSKKIGIVLGSYTHGINKFYGKTGSLWQQKTKAIELNKAKDAQEYLESCFHYIHQNPTRAGLVKKVQQWPHSSFKEYLRSSDVKICDTELALSLLNKSPLEFLMASKIVKENNDLRRFLYYNSQP